MNESEKEKNEDRLVALETKISYLEDFVNQLQEVTVEHEKQLQKVLMENSVLISRLKEISDSLEGDIPNRKPPHY